MKPLSFRPLLASACAFVVLLLALSPVGASEDATMQMTPQKIEVDSFYHGTDLKFEGTVPDGCQVAIVLAGEPKEQHLNRKGRVGLLWMNVGTVTFKGAPEVYCVLLSCDNETGLASPEELVKFNIGYDALRQATSIEQKDADAEATFSEFVRLREHMGLYRILCGSISLTPADNGTSRFTAVLPLPASVPPGEYDVSLLCFRDGKRLSNTTTKLTVEKTGMPERLSTLAYEHAGVYGVLSIVVAMAAGLSMGLVFGSKGKGGH